MCVPVTWKTLEASSVMVPAVVPLPSPQLIVAVKSDGTAGESRVVERGDVLCELDALDCGNPQGNKVLHAIGWRLSGGDRRVGTG